MSNFGPSEWTGRALQAESDDLERLVLRFCIRRAERPMMLNRSGASLRITDRVRMSPTGLTVQFSVVVRGQSQGRFSRCSRTVRAADGS
jgi:hypothetical protein